MADLTCYKLRTPPDGPVSDFDLAIDEKKLAGLQMVGPVEIGNTTAKLFLTGGFPHEPNWGSVIRTGFGDDVNIPKVAGASAVVVVRFEHGGTKHFLAFTFGYGFTLLRSDSYERGFGLKTSLNVVFEGDDGTDAINPARLRSVDAKRVGPSVLRSRHQVADSTSLEELDIDVRRDVLGGVTGTPQDQAKWGSRITGKDALHLSMAGDFSDLGTICERIISAYGTDDYRVRFSFVDDMQLEKDPVLRAQLEEEILGFLQGEQIESLGLAPPEMIEWDRVAEFRYHADKPKNPLKRRELRLNEYISALKLANLFNTLTVEKLKGYEIKSVDGSGMPVDRWTAWHCLHGEIEVGGKTYVLDDGDFYSVSADYLASLEEGLGQIEDCAVVLPDWITGSWEKDYNELAASSSPNYLLLDRRTVKVARHTTQVEICDLLTNGGVMIHVKRKSDGSSSLSHLFAQGFVAGDLLVANDPAFRKAAFDMIGKAGKERRKVDPGFDPADFKTFTTTKIDPAKHEVAFAILGDWKGGLETLPFFSKVMLRQIADDLARRNLKVTVKLVAATYGELKS